MDPSRKEYGPHIFARANYAYHVFLGWVRTRVFSGFGAIDVYGPETWTDTDPYQFVHS